MRITTLLLTSATAILLTTQASASQYCQSIQECWAPSTEGMTASAERQYDNRYAVKARYRGQQYGQYGQYGRQPYAHHPLENLPKQIAPKGHNVFVFSPRYKRWAAYDNNGQRVARGRANGGSHFCDDLGRACQTPVGTFSVHTKGSPDCKSRKFPVGIGGAPMPYCMYFQGGNAIHGSPWVSENNSSHGCIRVSTPAARWLHQNFMRVGTKVMVLPY